MKVNYHGSAVVTLTRQEINEAIAAYVARQMHRHTEVATHSVDFKYKSGWSSKPIGSATVNITFKD